MALLGKLPVTYPQRGAHMASLAPPQSEFERQETPWFWWGLNAERSLDCTDTSGH